MARIISASHLATLIDDFDRSPAYLGLSDAIRALVCDGRLLHSTRLPSERELTAVLQVSRTTVTRAYADLRERGYAEAKQGSGTRVVVPGGPTRRADSLLTPRADRASELIDLNCAAPPAAAGVGAAYQRALERLPAYLTGHGYFPAGLPELQERLAARFTARGLPTSTGQIMVTPGALTASTVVAQAAIEAGDRVLVESPGYPNSIEAFRSRHARLVDVPAGDIEAVTVASRQTSPRAAYLIPDFHNPTGTLMSDADRDTLAEALARSRTLAIIDEAHQGLLLEDLVMPRPLAASVEECGGETVTLGSSSKAFWGGLRLGWLRASTERMGDLARSRLALDLGTPVLEQLVLIELLDAEEKLLAQQRILLRQQRDALVSAMRAQLPEWQFTVPSGGLALWCRLPAPVATDLCRVAETLGVIVSPGPVFGVQGGYRHYVRVPWTLPVPQLQAAVELLAAAWLGVAESRGDVGSTSPRVMIA